MNLIVFSFYLEGFNVTVRQKNVDQHYYKTIHLYYQFASFEINIFTRFFIIDVRIFSHP